MSIKVIVHIFMLALTVLKRVRFEMFDLETLGQCHGEQQCLHLMGISMFLKVIIEQFLPALTVFQILKFQML